MYKVLTMMAILIAVPSIVLAQSGHSSYAGQDKREIKALSTEEIQAYLSGEGMGLAKATELNHYPGPKHVLDSAEELRLSKEQIARTKEIHNGMHGEAVALGKLIVAKESLLNKLSAAQNIDQAQLESLVSDISKLQGKLRATHLSAHLQTKGLLSSKQVAKYDALRGYDPNRGHDSHPRSEY